MSDASAIVTGLGRAELHRVLVRGHDLNRELVGKISFTDMVWVILRARLPTQEEARMLDALLVILVEHGMVTPVVAARSVYHNAPEAIQGAVAASLLNAGSKHLGSSEWCARMLQEAVGPDTNYDQLDDMARKIVDEYLTRKQYIAGIGHHTHNQGDPRAERLLEIARDTDVYGVYCEFLHRISQVASERHGRSLPINVTGAMAAIGLDMGLRWEMTKAFALIGRTLGALGHIQEEIERPMVERIKDAIVCRLEYEPGDTAELLDRNDGRKAR